MNDKAIIRVLAIFSAIVTIALGTIVSCTHNRISELKITEQLYVVAQDSLKIVKNDLNQQTATIEVLTSENNQLFTNLKNADEDIARLQELVRKYEKENGRLNTALVLTNTTVIHLQDSIKNIIVGYTYADTDSVVVYPVYKREFTRDWDSGTVTMGLSQLDLNIKVKNSYDITIGDEKVSLFKRKMFANITNLNPNTETQVMKVYQKQEVKTKIMRPIGVGLLGGIVAGYMLFH